MTTLYLSGKKNHKHTNVFIILFTSHSRSALICHVPRPPKEKSFQNKEARAFLDPLESAFEKRSEALFSIALNE